MAIGIKCNSDTTVAKPFTHDLGMNTLPQHKRGMGVGVGVGVGAGLGFAQAPTTRARIINNMSPENNLVFII